MKLDLDYIEEILQAIEDYEGGTISLLDLKNAVHSKDDKDIDDRFIHHIEVMGDSNIIFCEPENKGMTPVFGQRTPIIIGGAYRLTFHGHQTLEAMHNDTIWEQIKDSVAQGGISAIKKIPALALSALIAS